MPTTLRNERDLQLIAIAKKSGALTQDAVIALGKALHGLELDQVDQAALERCGELLDAITSEETGLRRQASSAQLFATNSGLTALWAAREEGHDEDALEFFGGLGASLKSYLRGETTIEEAGPNLAVLRDLFLRMGELNLAAVNAATQVHDIGTPWQPTARPSSS